MRTVACYAAALVLLVAASLANADPRSDYYQRAAARDEATFRALDVNNRGYVTREEVAGDNDFTARFRDMDMNGDGVITRAELARYISEHYGIEIPDAGKPTAATQHVEGASAG
jgi:hypothetical protein